MGKKSRNAGKVERRQAAGGGAHHKRKDEYRILKEDLDKFNETARALALDDDDKKDLEDYVTHVVYRTYTTDGLESALKALRRWPEIRDCWERMMPRFRRRMCTNTGCMKLGKLYQPRYLVCGACADFGVNFYYCSEACQREHWGEHKKKCPGAKPWYWDPLKRQVAISELRESISKGYVRG